jgi:hypothetical protein
MKEVINSGALQLIRDEDGSLSCQMKNHENNQPITIISSLPIWVFVTGDLAYFTAILGKSEHGRELVHLVWIVGKGVESSRSQQGQALDTSSSNGRGLDVY